MLLRSRAADCLGLAHCDRWQATAGTWTASAPANGRWHKQLSWSCGAVRNWSSKRRLRPCVCHASPSPKSFDFRAKRVLCDARSLRPFAAGLVALPNSAGSTGGALGASLVSRSGRLLAAKYPEPVIVHVDTALTPRSPRVVHRCVANVCSCFAPGHAHLLLSITSQTVGAALTAVRGCGCCFSEGRRPA